MKFKLFFLVTIVLLLPSLVVALEEDDFPTRVKVQPLFLVPKGQLPPTKTQILKLHKHMRIAQKRFKQMLSGRDTFEIAGRPRVIHSDLTLEEFKTDITKTKITDHLLGQFFTEFGCNRYNCPYVFFYIFMNPKENWPSGYGRPINPGFNSGGGIAAFPSKRIDDINTSVQGSIQHELGHAFGLVHVSSYGYEQRNNRSIMSYESIQIWRNFTPPKNPSILIPEDLRALALNKRVFPNVYFDYRKDIPKGYKLCRAIPLLGISPVISGQKPYEVKVSTSGGQEAGTKVGNVVVGFVSGNRKAKNGIGLVAGNMWMSDKKESGWVDLEVEFPIAVRMNRIRVYSQCGGGYHPIKGIRVEAKKGEFVEVAKSLKPLSDKEVVTFKETKAKQWRLHFLPGESKQVVIRGLDFLSSRGEFFSRNQPFHLMKEQKANLEQRFKK